MEKVGQLKRFMGSRPLPATPDKSTGSHLVWFNHFARFSSRVFIQMQSAASTTAKRNIASIVTEATLERNPEKAWSFT